MGLDLYAKCEDLLGIEDSTKFLHENFLDTLQELGVKTVLDFGCGDGSFIEILNSNGFIASGVDASDVMVQRAKAKNLNVENKTIDTLDQKYDAIVAIFDVLNFLDTTSLEKFLEDSFKILNPKGYLVADINTKFGFEEVAQGTANSQDEKRFMSVDAVYEDGELRTIFTLFEKQDNNLYTKEQDTITQYFHPMKFFKKRRDLKLVDNYKISLYANNDKELLIFRRD